MAESNIITPPSTPPPPPPTTTSPPTPARTDPDPEISLARLDSLLETYLELLDQYTTLRTQLSKQFSAGFFDLARANHSSTSRGSGRRYGDEGYDERMKAQRRVVYVAGDAEECRDDGQGAVAEGMGTPGEGGKGDRLALQARYKFSIQKMNEAAAPDETSRETGSSSGTTTKVKPLPSQRDPLNWYGILVPPPLRQAQASFISAVENSVPRLLNTSHAMHELETRINEYRMELGLRQGPEADLDGDETTVATPEDVNAANASSQPSRPTKEARYISTSSRKHLVQRPSEPRLRILKLDH